MAEAVVWDRVRPKYRDEGFMLPIQRILVAAEPILGRIIRASQLSTVEWPRFPRDSDEAKCLGADADYDSCSLKQMLSQSSRRAVIVSQEAAEPRAALDLAPRLADFLTWINQLIAQSLMVPLSVIVFQELADSGAKHLLAEKDHFQETLFFEASHESLDRTR